jgi:mersacidin/lichenicidin family type 2 lantibiotic
MSVEQIIEVWKSPAMRRSLGVENLAAMPENPAGSVAKELDEAELALAAGGHYCGSGWIPSHTAECTCSSGITVCNWSRCTHRTHRGCT